jgi:DNA-binding phage protein
VPDVPPLVQQLVRIRRKRMTASETARKMGVSRQQIYNIENATQGCPTLDTVARYARAIGARLKVVP